MHYHAEIWIPEFKAEDFSYKAIYSMIEKIMAPYDEELRTNFIEVDCEHCADTDDNTKNCDFAACGYEKINNLIGYWENDKGFWDWWQIGGRWSGIKFKNYDPRKDPRNHKKCDMCHGTGYRDSNICNVCGYFNEATECIDSWEVSPGIKVIWPGWNWADVNIKHVSAIKDPVVCCTVIYGPLVKHIEEYKDEGLIKTDFDGDLIKFIKENNIKDGYFVTVDYHN